MFYKIPTQVGITRSQRLCLQNPHENGDPKEHLRDYVLQNLHAGGDPRSVHVTVL